MLKMKLYEPLHCFLFFVLALSLLPGNLSRNHHLTLTNDIRRYFSVSTFGFFQGGRMSVDVQKISFNPESTVGKFGFSLTRTLSNSVTPYLESHQETCLLLDETLGFDNNVNIISFVVNTENNVVVVNCSNSFNLRKIEQLQKELADERARDEIRHYAEEKGVVKKKDDRLDWMYQGPAALVDREQYLTGRQLDKTFDILEQMENKNQSYDNSTDQPGAIFSQTNVNVTVDLANKIREDPLFAIRKRETDQKKQLLNNPVKMKQLRELLEQSVGSLDKKSKKKRKKDKKRKKRKTIESDNTSDSSEDESPRKKSKHGNKEKSSTSKHKHEESVVVKEKNAQEIRDKYYRNGKEYGLIGGKKLDAEPRQERHRSRSPPRKNNRETVLKSRNDSRQRETRARSPPPRWQRNEPKKKLDPEEAERKRREMMDDAKWRQEQRERNVRKYREEEEREERIAKQAHANQKHETPDFIKPLLSKAADTGSVESRVKQKMYNIQRNRSAMDQNFAKR